ncbi:hypothetical protein [Dictyobacter arantiisoli]|uniref:Uncharacterized protein n=1 Tax=Dictyobacter arantiisoli TaxID=2014874 RepID=A0A5A5T5Z0_9CHLR|nr:hypothetical protein [Dictyobacter arantiisoli]GCF06802.1 hypothetical protein KDI_03660 [Dictyobacter arantiisoli]
MSTIATIALNIPFSAIHVSLTSYYQMTHHIATVCPVNSPNAPTQIESAITNIVNFMSSLGAVVCALGIAVGGLMRATSFGNERRVSESNMAITCAVIGLGTVLLAQTLGTWLGGMFC